MRMSLEKLREFATAYVNAQKQAGAWSESRDNLYKALDKIGLMITLNGRYEDKLPELDGTELPLGKTIEEYFLDLTLPENFDFENSGENALKPYLPSVGEVSYSYTLGRKVIPTTIAYNTVERAAINAEAAGDMIANISAKLASSYKMYTFSCKKQLLGNLAAKAKSAGLYEKITAVTDTKTGGDFIKKVKTDIEGAMFANVNCIGNDGLEDNEKHLIGGAEASDLVLYVKKSVMPVIEVDVEAGAFNGTKVALPVRIKVVDDFGSNKNVTAMLVDTRGVKLHRGYHAVRTQENAYGDFTNIFDHSEHTGFISKYTFVKVYE